MANLSGEFATIQTTEQLLAAQQALASDPLGAAE